MTSLEEFTFIAAQLEWLEGHLRSQPRTRDSDARLETALNALACARAVIHELALIGDSADNAQALPPVVSLARVESWSR